MIFVIDDFLKNPDKVRVDAYKMYANNSGIDEFDNYPGLKIPIYDDALKIELQNSVRKCVRQYVNLVECSFQFIDKSFVKGLPHDDSDVKFTSIIYMNINPEDNSGTEIYDYCYKSRDKCLYKEEDYILNYKRDFILEKNKSFLFKYLYGVLVDKVLKDQPCPTVISNKYNRNLIFDSKYVHRAQNYFGKGRDSRLCLVSFYV